MKTAYRYISQEEYEQVRRERCVTRRLPDGNLKEEIFITLDYYNNKIHAAEYLALFDEPFARVMVQIPDDLEFTIVEPLDGREGGGTEAVVKEDLRVLEIEILD